MTASLYLLDEHVQILGKLGGEACLITLSVLTAQRHKRRNFSRDVFPPPMCVASFREPYRWTSGFGEFGYLFVNVSNTLSILAPLNFHTGDKLDLGNAVGVTEDDTDLRRGSTLSGELADLVDDLVGGGLQPRGSGAGVGESGGRNALALAVKSAHLVCLAAAVVVMLRMVSSRSRLGRAS